MLRELAHRTPHTPHRTIVVDNGSTDGTVEMLHDLWEEGIVNVLVLNPENWGIHWGHNRRLELVRSDLYVATDDDLVPEAPRNGTDWLGKLVALMEARPELAAVACPPHFMVGDSVERLLAHPKGDEGVVERGHIGGHLRLMRTQAVRDVGGWQDTKRPKRNNEEKWICSRLRKAGWWVGYARDVRAIVLWGEEGEDPWGYDGDCKPEDHGHREIWPPVNRYSWQRQGVDWETCRREDK
jgi:GT2 family glycosyltransferase